MPSPNTEVWYQAHESDGSLWCETRDPDDPYLLPSRPDQKLQYRKLTVVYVPRSEITAFEPSPATKAKGHPSTWEEEDS